MRKALRAAALLLAFTTSISGCSSAKPSGAGGAKGDKLPSPEEDPKAPGQIPQECEALLNQSRDWGFAPEKNWKPANEEVAKTAVKFFGGFHLVPEATSNFLRAWAQESVPDTAPLAQASLDRLNRTQSCDFLLAHKLLLALLARPWPKADREDAGHEFLRFVLNQQARVEPPIARAVQIDVLVKAAEKGLVKVKTRDAKAIHQWFQESMAKHTQSAAAVAEADAVGHARVMREDLRLSEEARERLSRILPLP